MEHFVRGSRVITEMLKQYQRYGGHYENTKPGRRQERALIAKAQAGDEDARTELLARNAPLIVNLVKEYTIRGIPADDRANAALMGYSEGIDSYRLDHYKMVRLATWALPMARYRIQALKRQRYQVSIPHNVDLAVHVQRKSGSPEIIGCKSASKLTIAAALNICEESMDSFALDQHGEEIVGTRRIDLETSAESHESEILDRISTEQMYARVIAAMGKCLTAREQKIMHDYYIEGHTIQVVADNQNLSRERIRQILAFSVSRIQWALEGRPFTHTIKDRESREMTGRTKGKRKECAKRSEVAA